MPMFVAGYFLTFATARALMHKLQIDDRGVEIERIEYPINNWLAERGKCNILAGAIGHPITGDPSREDGILLMTQFILTSQPNPVVKEGDRDLLVKEWLLNEGGVNPDDLEWMSLWDDFNLTRNGISPRCNEVRGHRTAPFVPPSSKLVSAEQLKRWMASGLDMKDFLIDEAKHGRWTL